MVDDAALVLVCAECNGLLESKPSTDGDGGLIELVRPCPRCRVRIRQRPAPEPPPRPADRLTAASPLRSPSGGYLCVTCGRALVYGGRGRPPSYCELHKPGKAA